MISSVASTDCYHIWYQCLGHCSKNALGQLSAHASGCPSITIPSTEPPCSGCAMGKMPNHHFGLSIKQMVRPLALLYTDLMGPFPVESCSLYCYVLMLVNDSSGFALFYFLWEKSGTFGALQCMFAWLETQCGSSAPLSVPIKGGIHWMGCSVVLLSQGDHSSDLCASYPSGEWLGREIQPYHHGKGRIYVSSGLFS